MRVFHVFKIIQMVPNRAKHHKYSSWNQFLVIQLKGALSGLRQFLATESPLKMIKNVFYFTSKALLVLKILKFLSWIFGHDQNGLIKKVGLIPNLMNQL